MLTTVAREGHKKCHDLALSMFNFSEHSCTLPAHTQCKLCILKGSEHPYPAVWGYVQRELRRPAPRPWLLHHGLAGFPLEEGKHLSQDGFIVPHCSSTCASAVCA